MLADGAAARNQATDEPRVSVAETHPTSWLSQFTTHVLSSVRHPSPLTRISIGVPTGPSVGCIERLAHIDPALGKGHAVFREEHFVNAAIVFGNPEGDRCPTIRAHLHLCEGSWLYWRSASHESGNTPRPPILRSPFPRPNRSFDWRQPFSARFDLSACDSFVFLGYVSVSFFSAAEVGFGAVGRWRLEKRRSAADVAPARDRVRNASSVMKTRGAYSTIVAWESSTTKGLNSPVRPYLSVAVTV